MAITFGFMDIPTLLRDVKKERGYKSVEDMAYQEGQRMGSRISIASLRSWMTENPRTRRSPTDLKSWRTISLITGLPIEVLDGSSGANGGDVRADLT